MRVYWVSWIWHEVAFEGEGPFLDIWRSVEYPFIAITPNLPWSRVVVPIMISWVK